MSEDFSTYETEYSKLLDPTEPLDSRIRELYRLKEAILKTPAGVHILKKAVDLTDSVLLQHELVYNLGQSGMKEACPFLEYIISQVNIYDTITRHEAVEALGAIASSSSKFILEKFMNPLNETNVSIRESCELALERIRLYETYGEMALKSPLNCPYVSIDPAPAFNIINSNGHHIPSTIDELEEILCNEMTSLWRRYQAMFSLRNMGTEAAVLALTRALRYDTTSVLFRHEVAFVLGQLEHPASQLALVETLKDEEEAPMVRHEAAEALGAMADPTMLKIFEMYSTHTEPIVRDSCVVALEMQKYWSRFSLHGLENVVA